MGVGIINWPEGVKNEKMNSEFGYLDSIFEFYFSEQFSRFLFSDCFLKFYFWNAKNYFEMYFLVQDISEIKVNFEISKIE